MKRFLFDLPDDLRAELEAIRVRRGLRSLAQVLHSLIREEAGRAKGLGGPEPVKPVALPTQTAAASVKPARVSVGSLVSLPPGAKLKG